ncbi:hypothetical protein [Megalodesulfovibrio gigas]|uniref:Uncharacterized protein n=1 Tax=Megalodesulfovibrio gigas (strain ATCC 19364 / DSM 1382 / NCIMB 9332 / VKM B-1759) TaxID=1121448 RepID=T2GF60_MEGG1|nr:hypothetical protein [Megalodesulfovibrio gigas]AGW14928.1 hypothetical protein DGI_3224 [Megalodesulfovibrio gigas DSM 1382 = ATCC 19364]
MAEPTRNDSALESITLQNDSGPVITFDGRLCGEHSFYDAETGALTQQKLYITNQGYTAYAVVRNDGRVKERRAYLLKREGQFCRINNGQYDVVVNVRDLLLAVKGLCGLEEDAREEDFFKDAMDIIGQDDAANG